MFALVSDDQRYLAEEMTADFIAAQALSDPVWAPVFGALLQRLGVLYQASRRQYRSCEAKGKNPRRNKQFELYHQAAYQVEVSTRMVAEQWAAQNGHLFRRTPDQNTGAEMVWAMMRKEKISFTYYV